MPKTPIEYEDYRDGRPCTMDEFVSRLFTSTDDHYERMEAIEHWLYGDWDKAMDYLSHRETGR